MFQLQSGKQCLCRYMLPSCLRKSQPSLNLDFPDTSSVSHDLKIIGLADAVEGRINVIVNNGQVCLFIRLSLHFPLYIYINNTCTHTHTHIKHCHFVNYCAFFFDKQIT